MIDAQTATSTYDCVRPGCTGEAPIPGGLCRDHSAFNRGAGARRPIADARLELPAVCKVCGGELDELGRTTSSNRHRLKCADCRAASAKAAVAKAAKGSSPTSSPPAASNEGPKPEAAPGPAAKPGELTKAALALEQASARLKSARDSYAAARARLDAALDELLEEPAA